MKSVAESDTWYWTSTESPLGSVGIWFRVSVGEPVWTVTPLSGPFRLGMLGRSFHCRTSSGRAVPPASTESSVLVSVLPKRTPWSVHVVSK